MKSDIEIAREVSLRKIKEIATGLGIPREEVQNYGSTLVSPKFLPMPEASSSAMI